MTPRRASSEERAAAMPRSDASFWVRGRSLLGLDDRTLGAVYALAYGEEMSARRRPDARETMARRVEDAVATGWLLVIARPVRRVIMHVERSEPVLGPEDELTSWIEIELVDQDGKPVVGEPYEIVTGDERVRRGTLNLHGRAREEGIDPAACKVSFPQLREWRAA